MLFPDIKSRNASPRSCEKKESITGTFSSGKKQSHGENMIGNLTTPFAYAKKSVPPNRANKDAIIHMVSTERG